MFLVEIGGMKVLYTGDYSRLADRHLSAADLPDSRPDIGIPSGSSTTQHSTRPKAMILTSTGIGIFCLKLINEWHQTPSSILLCLTKF